MASPDNPACAQKIAEDEERHEQKLLAILDEERLQYVGSMVLGLNDALVELTGTLAGLTLALQNTKLHEHMNAYAYISIFDAILKLTVAYLQGFNRLCFRPSGT